MGVLRRLRAALRLAAAVLHGLVGLFTVLVLFPRLSRAARQAHIARWSSRMLACLGVAIQVQGRFREDGFLLVANHVSWLDIMAIHAVYPRARFVSKADVQGWPLVNRLVDGADTLYLQRERARDALRVVHQMAGAMEQGDCVAVFPEGTTGSGHALLPFHANLLQAAISVAVPIQPVALRYADDEHPISHAVDFLGDTTLAQSLWRIACGQGLRVSVTVLPARATAHADRRALAQVLRQDIAQALGEAPAPPPAPTSEPSPAA